MDAKREQELLAKYPFHIYLMIMAAKKALDEGRATIQDEVLMMNPPSESDSEIKGNSPIQKSNESLMQG